MLSGPNIFDGILSRLSDNDLVSPPPPPATVPDDEADDPCSWILSSETRASTRPGGEWVVGCLLLGQRLRFGLFGNYPVKKDEKGQREREKLKRLWSSAVIKCGWREFCDFCHDEDMMRCLIVVA